MSDAELARQFALIGAIYDCALNPEAWPTALRQVCEALDGHSAGIVVLDFKGAGDRLVRDWGPTTDWGVRMAPVLDSVKHIHRQFLGITGPRADEPIILPRDLASSIEVFKTPFYNEWAAPQRIHQVMEAVALSETTRLGLFCVTRQDHKGEFSEPQIALMRNLAPHIRRAITISDLLDLRTIERQAFLSVIDQIPCGVCVVGDGGQILHSNAAARAMLEAKSPIIGLDGRLRAAESACSSALMEAIGAAQQDVDMRSSSGSIGVPLGLFEGAPAIAYVLPLARGDIRTRLVPQALAAVFISTSSPATFFDLDGIAKSFGFTPAETRLASELLLGRSLAEAAAELGVGESTVKTHLKNVFYKAGVARQVDLIALLMRLLPSGRRPS